MQQLVAAFCPTCLRDTTDRLTAACLPYQVMDAGYSASRPCFACAAATHHLLIAQ